MSEIMDVNESNFSAEVLSATSPVLVDFTAEWCGPCKMLDPVIEQLAVEMQDKLRIVRLDIDQNVNLTAQYGVMGVPTLMLFIGGEIKERMTGYQPRERLTARLTPHL